jgi:hypothetical protein
VTFLRERRFRHAYAIPLLESAGAAANIRRYLEGLDVHAIGRYGEWKYSNMEDALLDGRKVIDERVAGLAERSAG